MKKVLNVSIASCLVLLISAFAFVGCNSEPKNITADSTEVTYEMNKEDTITITLEENGSTGYTWNYTIEDADIMEYVSDNYEAPAEEGMVGVPGEHTWIFKAIGTGNTKIDFALARDWEEGEQPAETRMFKINVK